MGEHEHFWEERGTCAADCCDRYICNLCGEVKIVEVAQ